MKHVRKISRDDYPALLTLGKAVFDHSGIAGFGAGYSKDSVFHSLDDLRFSKYGVCLVYEVSGTIYGCISGTVSPLFYDREKSVLCQQWLWVSPDIRRHGIGTCLSNALMDWGRNNGCAQMIISSLETDSVRHFYGNLGFTPFETHFLRRL
jgi:GNAT superfamily N-acetyltransferase